MIPLRVLVASASLLIAVTGPALAHTGGTNGYATVTVGREDVRYSLTLWPAALPAAVAERIERARGGDAPSRDALVGIVRDKVTLTAQGRRCAARPGSMSPPGGPSGSLTLVVDFACGGEVRLVVAVALPAPALLRRTRWKPRMVWGSSLAILLAGIVLFVERAFF